jgi:hypothetical protein
MWAVHAHAVTGTTLARELGIGVLASDVVDALARTFVALDPHLV